MFRDLNLSSFLGGYGHSIMSKTSFIISWASFILTLNILLLDFCKLNTKRNRLDTPGNFVEFEKNVENDRLVSFWGHISFKMASSSEKSPSEDEIDGILTVIDSGVLTELNYLRTESIPRVSEIQVNPSKSFFVLCQNYRKTYKINWTLNYHQSEVYEVYIVRRK